MYAPASGRFNTKDSWQGDYNRPMSYNAWLYVYANPINYIDPSGLQGTDPRCTDWSSSWFVPTNLKYDKCVELWSAHDAGETGTIHDWYSWLWSSYTFGPFEYASALGMHFLGNTGEEYQMPEGFGNAIRDLKIVKNSIKDHKNWYMVNYVKAIAEGQSSSGSYIFGRDDFVNGIAITGVEPYLNPKIFLAWNAFFIDVHYQGTVEKKNTILGYTYTIQINMSYRAHDTYDWHPGLTIPNPFGGEIPDAWAYLLDEKCLAESFDSYYEWSNQEKHTIIFNNWPKYKTTDF
jgi:hypothetical protein